MISSITPDSFGSSSADSHSMVHSDPLPWRRSNSMKHCWNRARSIASVPGRGAAISLTISSNALLIGSSSLAWMMIGAGR